jgi:deoxyribose-phosphate aldolase
MSFSLSLKDYLDATFLTTAKQIGCSKEDITQKNIDFVIEIIPFQVKALIIRPNMLDVIKPILIEKKSQTLLGTVIDFPNGDRGLKYKLKKAKKAIENGADELDFVCNYKDFKNKNTLEFIDEIVECTKYVLEEKKTIKWIIETAALTSKEIVQICAIIKNTLVSKFKENQLEFIFMKSSTGYFKTKNKQPNGATFETITMMLENASPLKIKASGGIKTQEDAVKYLKMGVSRLGTSAALDLVNNHTNKDIY